MLLFRLLVIALLFVLFLFALVAHFASPTTQDAESEASVQQALDKLVERGAGSTTVVLVAHR